MYTLNTVAVFLLGVVIGFSLGLAIMWAYREWDERDRAYDDDIGKHEGEGN